MYQDKETAQRVYDVMRKPAIEILETHGRTTVTGRAIHEAGGSEDDTINFSKAICGAGFFLFLTEIDMMLKDYAEKYGLHHVSIAVEVGSKLDQLDGGRKEILR